ncbi:hypothetical protein C8F01DRAFT_1123227 [Mycena amicta]|nr:hypothetical protein C8F01DRAFT_1123227 [Mycena amicta]
MLDQLPPEVCGHIFSFACTDTGTTGRSLSLVSRYIHNTSAPHKLQSVALFGRPQYLAFAALLHRTPPHLRGTRFLYIGGQESEEKLQEVVDDAYREWHAARLSYYALKKTTKDSEDLDQVRESVHRLQAVGQAKLLAFGQTSADAVLSILRDLAPSLQVLDIALNEYAAEKLVDVVALPNLCDLTTRCGFPLRNNSYTTSALEPCRTLRHLHIVETSQQWHWTTKFFEGASGIAQFAPSLTHLRFSQLSQDEEVPTHIATSLGLMSGSTRIVPLPASIQQITLKPAVEPPPHVGCSCTDDTATYYDLVDKARKLVKKDSRVLLLPADEKEAPADIYLDEWEKNAAGSPCIWVADCVDS